jgi:Ca-activated chloride channel family protein
MTTANLLTDGDLPRTPDEEAGFGALKTTEGCLPLKALEIDARLLGMVVETSVRQTFVNAFEETLEAVYIFPVPPRAAVTAFRMEVNGRVVEGTLLERKDARQAYEKALRDGHRAALGEQERQDVLTISVGNLAPRETATVQVQLAGLLPCVDGEVTFRFPLVVAPRYIPGVPLPGADVGAGTASDTDAVPDASRITPPILLPGFPNPVHLALTVDIDPGGFELSDLRSSLLATLEQKPGQGQRLCLQVGQRLDRDFILRFRIGGTHPRAALLLSPDAAPADEGTFLVTLVPPTAGRPTAKPRTVGFVLDRSGSMGGWKIVAARRALARMVDTLRAEDRFAVFAFDTVVETPPALGGPAPVPATDRHRFRAVEFLTGLQARGGTEMLPALAQALTQLGTDQDRDRLLVLVTDGQVGNEAQILQALGDQLAAVRVFVVGIDQAVNAGFLERLARMTGGHCELVESEDRLDGVLEVLHRRLEAPVLTDLRLQPEGFAALPESLAPNRLPDLFPSTALVVAGRYRGQPGGTLVLTGTDGNGRRWEERVTGAVTALSALTPVWARAHLLDLEDRFDAGAGDRAALERRLVWTSLRYKVLCRFTAYVAVDRSATIDPTGHHRIIQPVDLPAGWGDEAPTIARRQASVAEPRLAFRLAQRAVSTPELIFEPLREWLREVDQGSETIPMLLRHLARYHGLVARLRLLLNNATKLGLRDTDRALLAALLQQLELLLATAEEIRRHHTEMQRLATDFARALCQR